jgi:hypothetical protein
MKVNCQTLLLLRIAQLLIIMGIQSRSRNPRHPMNNNKNNHTIDSVASTIILGQALEVVPLTSQGQAEAVPLRHQSQPLHRRLLEMKAKPEPLPRPQPQPQPTGGIWVSQIRVYKTGLRKLLRTPNLENNIDARVSLFTKWSFQASRFLQLHLQRVIEKRCAFLWGTTGQSYEKHLFKRPQLQNNHSNHCSQRTHGSCGKYLSECSALLTSY